MAYMNCYSMKNFIQICLVIHIYAKRSFNIFLHKPCFFQIEIIMLWVYGHYRYVLQGHHQNMTSIDKVGRCTERVNNYPAKLIYLNFHPLEVVSR